MTEHCRPRAECGRPRRRLWNPVASEGTGILTQVSPPSHIQAALVADAFGPGLGLGLTVTSEFGWLTAHE